MAKWWNKIVGEMSNLRQKAFGLFGGSFAAPYKLDSSRVDYKRSRELYYNTQEDYKLGSGFAKPMINIKAAFMGVPEFKSEDKDAKEVLDEFSKENRSKMQNTHRNALREADCFVWITREDEKDKSLYPETETVLKYNIIPPESIKQIIRDPVTQEPTEYVIMSQNNWETELGEKRQAKITQRIRPGSRIVEVEGDVPPGIEPGEHPTPWDFIPIVHFKNESDVDAEFGKSDLEVIEPFMKAYHDVFMHAIKGSKMHSTPRLKLKLKDVAGFLKNNFGVTDPAKFARQGGTIDLDGHELLLLANEEDAEFVEARSAIGDAKDLLQMLFYCIVDAAEIPEFIFGVHTPSSQASVKEQMPIMVKAIERKRDQMTSGWQRLARIVLAMTSQSENRSFSTYATKLSWDTIDPRDGTEVADELKTVVEAISVAINNNLMSQEAAVKYLGKLVETMNEYESDDPDVENEKDRIAKSKLDRERMADTEFLQKQLESIKKKIGDS